MSPAEASTVETTWKQTRAVEMAAALHTLLGELCGLPQHGAGSRFESAWDLMDCVLDYLDPDGAPERPWKPGRKSIKSKRGGSAPLLDSVQQFQLRQMREIGASIIDCAKHFKVSTQTTLRILAELRKTHGLEKLPPGRCKRAARAHLSLSNQTLDVDNMRGAS